MAEIQWSTDARITNLTLNADNPGQITHEIPSTGTLRVFNQSFGRWTGTIQLGQVESQDQGQRIEAFIAGLRGSQNATRVPLSHIKGFASDSNTPVRFSDVVAGRYYNIGDRLFVAYGGGVVFPNLPIAPSTAVRPATFILVRLAAGASPLLPHRPDQYGPWAIQIQEVSSPLPA